MEIYTPKNKIKLSPVIRNGREFVEVTFGNDNDIRLSLSKEENVLLVGGRAYLRAELFLLLLPTLRNVRCGAILFLFENIEKSHTYIYIS